jgi:hypothetical protein
VSKLKIAPYRVISNTPDSDYGVTITAVQCFSRAMKLQLKKTDPIIPMAFNSSQDPLRIQMTLTIRNIAGLFHPEPTAVATSGAKLGIALFWESRQSGRRGMGKSHCFSENDTVTDIPLFLEFSPGELRGEIVFTPKVFLNDVGGILPGYCSVKGGLLGCLNRKQTVIIDGEGSKFPIYESSEGPQAPLWRVQMDWDNPLEDTFFDHFRIIINQDHADYPMVRRIDNPAPGQDVVQVALKEIITSTLFGMMMKLKEVHDDWASINENKSQPKSIGQLAWTYMYQQDWNTVSPAALLQDIRKTVEGGR